MNGLDLLAFAPAVLFLVAAWIVAERVARTGNATKKPDRPERAAGWHDVTVFEEVGLMNETVTVERRPVTTPTATPAGVPSPASLGSGNHP